MTPRPRWCPRCKASKPWSKVRLLGARAGFRACMDCGGRTSPRKPGRRRKPSALKVGVQLADELFARIVKRDGLDVFGAKPPRGQVLECAHVVSRTHKGVRWDEDNAMSLASGTHKQFTHNPLAWEVWCLDIMGAIPYADLKRRALPPWDKDIVSVLARLIVRAYELGLIHSKPLPLDYEGIRAALATAKERVA